MSPSEPGKDPEKISKKDSVSIESDARVNIFLASTLMNVFQWVIIIQSEPTLITTLSVDKARVVNLLGTTQGIAGALSFLLYPFLGKLSDSIGRKPGLLLAPLSNALTGALVTVNPNSLFLVLLNRVLRMFTLSFSNTVMNGTALSDFLFGKSLAINFSRLKAATGLAVVVAPQIETMILKMLKSPRYAYASFTAAAIFQSIFHLLITPEALHVAKRVSLDSVMKWHNLNPLKFLKLYTQGSVNIRRLATIYGLQMLGEGKNTSDLNYTWMTEKLKWDLPARNYQVSLYGVEGICSGIFVAPRLIKMYSGRTFTTIANIAVGLSGLVQGCMQTGSGLLLATMMQLPGINGVCGTAINALASDLASSEGFGKGEFAGIMGNFRSMAGIVSPVLLGRYVSWLKVKGLQQYMFTVYLLVAIFTSLIPELLHQNIDYAQINARVSKSS